MADSKSNRKEPQFTVVMMASNQAAEVEQNLPGFLEQDYEPGYEVVVVDESSTDDTDDLLKRLKLEHPHLYTTFLPKHGPNTTRPKMGLNLGVKAAKYEWLVITSINTPPPSADWLKELAAYIDDSTPLTLGYISRKDGSVRLQPFSQLSQAQPLISKAERRLGKGHQGKRLRYLCGKYDFVVTPTQTGHEALNMYECNISGWRLFWLRVRVMLYNLIH